MGQLLTKSIDGLLTTHWTYDSAGLAATIKRAGTSSFIYDPYNRLIKIVDEEGAQTNITYEERDQVLVKTIRDPRNIETIETYNAHNLLLKREIPGSFCLGSLLEEFEYDLALRLIRQGPLHFSYSPKGNQTSLTEAETRTTFWTYTPSGKIQTKTKPDGTLLSYEYNSQGELIKVSSRLGSSREFQYDRLGRLTKGSGFSRTLDPFGNILKEEFSNGLMLESTYDDWNRPLTRTLPDYSRIVYEYEGPYLRRVTRLNPKGSTLYSHIYEEYNEAGLPLSETGLFQTTYTYDKTGRRTSQINPYLNDTLIYDKAGNLIQRGTVVYTYDKVSQLTSETDKFTALYDQHYNCIEKNGKPQPVDAINQIQGLPYDINGNLTKPGFGFDVFDQLLVEGENLVYDALGRRLQKGHTSYLYIDDEEIGSFEAMQPQELKIPGHQNIVAIEIKNRPYAPVQDVQGTIRYLIDWKTKKIAQENTCDAFGSGLTDAIPYAYAGKRYDAKTNLVYFGKRYYDPELSRWLTRDPLGPIDHSNLYQYVFNNPFAYRDPTGEFAFAIPLLVWGAELVLPSLTAFIVPVAYTALTGIAAYAGYKVSQVIYERSYDNVLFKNSSTVRGPSNASKKGTGKGSGRPDKLKPDPDTKGVVAHSVFRRHPETNKVIKYETFKPQTNPRDPAPYESVKRYDGPGAGSHRNKVLDQEIEVPHVHDPSCPGGIRPALPWEIPK
ncbi:tRNA3(Ser)-specific nuclease WapA precursor [Candidatus Rhabdochlamydia sp. T3358]|nr:tRNA3(Ser)-specific nuclease WapA precursor [Candidatus Rhabdochlamydia sp. T3358]